MFLYNSGLDKYKIINSQKEATMKIENKDINSYYWFNEKAMLELKSYACKINIDPDIIELIELRCRELKKIQEYSRDIELLINEAYKNFKIEDIDIVQLTSLVKDNLSIELETISAAIIVFNEERCIRRCIDSIINIVDEIVIVDTGSTDNTIDYIRGYNKKKIKLYTVKWNNNFAEIRNFAIKKVTSKWIFFIDADEHIVDREIKYLINSFNKFPKIDFTVFSPSIINANEHKLLNVKRIFTKKSEISFWGKVHEEPIKFDVNDKKTVSYICLDIKINHDGYLKEIIKNKQKVKRNLELLKEMIEIDNNNPRWKYFYIRDGFQVIDKNDIQELITEQLLKEKSMGFNKNNIIFNEFTFGFLNMLVQIKLEKGEIEKLEEIIFLLDELVPNNSNAFYYLKIKELIENKNKIQKLLMETINYRKNHYEIQYGMLHSNGYHIDFLIAVLLFEKGDYKNSLKYFEFLNDKYIDCNILGYYKELIKNIKDNLNEITR